MIPPTFEIGPLTLHIYGIVVSLSIFIGWQLAKKRAYIYKIKKEHLESPLIILPLIFSLVGARVYHVVDMRSFYSKNVGEIINVSNGGLGILGGLLGFFLGLYLLAKIKRIKFLSLLDLVSPPLLLGQAIGRFGNFVNQEAFGPPTQKPWGIFISESNRPRQFIESTRFHPTFFYEAALDLLFFFTLLFLSKKFKVPGQTFSLYLILYGLGRFTVEFWRIDTWEVAGFKVAHAVSLLLIAVGIFAFFLFRQKNGKLRG